MARTQVTGGMIADEGVVRADLNVSTPGSAVIRKVIAGAGVSIAQTGVDAGTGDVTIAATGGGGTTIGKGWAVSNGFGGI